MRNFAYGTDPTESHARSSDAYQSAVSSLDSFDSLVLLSNRQPYRHSREPDGSVSIDRPTGGLTAALDPVLERVGGTWLAWGDGDADRSVVDEDNRLGVPPDDPAYTLERVWIDDQLADAYYNGYSNRLLWPLCHGMTDVASSRRGDYEGYRTVNERFADRVTPHATSETLIWLQDYHLALAPAMIQERVPSSTTIGQFWHIPWPKPETFSRIPQGPELLEGLLGNDVLSFHIERFADRFLACVEYFLDDATVDTDASVIAYDGSETQIVTIPLGIDAATHAEQSVSADEDVFPDLLESLSISDTPVLGLGVDRLDYTKGIPDRIDAIESLLERRPMWIGEFTFVQTATPSRTDIPAYADYGESVRTAVDRVNERFATDSWRPIVYTEAYLSREQLCTLYRHADLMLVTPLSDGMNLVAKEYVAASIDESGALCLSEHAGAHDELGQAAYSVDPTDPDSMWRTVEEALTAPEAERRDRMQRLRAHVFDHTLEWWMEKQFEAFASRKREPSALSPGYTADQS